MIILFDININLVGLDSEKYSSYSHFFDSILDNINSFIYKYYPSMNNMNPVI